MPRAAKGLKSDVSIRAIKKPGYHADGGGLYLQVTASGARSWIFRYTGSGRRHEMGLGSYPDVTLKAARETAAEMRSLRAAGRDPLQVRRAERQQRAGGVTFAEAAAAYIAAHEPSWRNPKHRQQWSNTLATYVLPSLGSVPVADIETSHVTRVLEPIWLAKTETATRVRQRVEAILDWAAARGLRTGENPARWRGHLDKLLARPTRVRTVRHHPALPYAELPAFMLELEGQKGVAARALTFCILTAARTGEVIGALWSEIDGDVWTIPGTRMKSGREHRVPLSLPAQQIIEELRALSADADGFVFPGGRGTKPLSNMAMAAVLKRMGRGGITAHGFRSSFRDWARESTNFPREVAETSLAHILKDKVEAAYARGDLLDKRRELMAAWADYALLPAAGAAATA
jgi:integrase